MSTDNQDKALFYSPYANFEQSVLAQVRVDTYGEDIGQFSWLTADEFRRFLRWLELSSGSAVLDVACGSGGPALYMGQLTGCQVTGIDINENGVNTANRMALARGMAQQARFYQGDAARSLAFDNASFDAVTCIDAINHFYNRHELFREWFRVLRPGGRILFTDAVIVTGMLLREEIMARSSSMGQFIFSPPGLHEQLVVEAGFERPVVEDVTGTISSVTGAWYGARLIHANALIQLEGQAAFDAMQEMLATAHKLSSERRLSRFVYVARKPL